MEQERIEELARAKIPKGMAIVPEPVREAHLVYLNARTFIVKLNWQAVRKLSANCRSFPSLSRMAAQRHSVGMRSKTRSVQSKRRLIIFKGNSTLMS
jgi:hypothetical protein